ncbi:MAG: alpha/beta hydrolase domain-containing protein, partial [Burkholderiaceae bacterium]
PGLPYAGIFTVASCTDNAVFPPKELGRSPVFVPRADGFGAGTLFPLQGSVVPFAKTRVDRDAAHDPRPSLAERYGDGAAYVAAVREAAERLVAERLLLPEDAHRALESAAQDRLSRLQ